MPKPEVNVFPTERNEATAAADKICELIGDRPDWKVSISSRDTMDCWFVEVWRGDRLVQRMKFTGANRTVGTIIGHFRFQLRPHLDAEDR